jgi:hypothetical protein
MSILSLDTMIYDIVSINNVNYYILDKLKIIVNDKNELVGVYNYNYSTISKTEEEITKYIIDNKCLIFL